MCTCEPCFWKVLPRPVVTPLPIILSTISGLSYNITDPVWCRQCQFSELVQCTIIMYNNDDTATGTSLIMLSVLFLISILISMYFIHKTPIGKICALNIHLQHISVIYQQFNWNYCFSASIAGPPWPRRATTPAPGTPVTSARPRWEKKYIFPE